MAGMGIGYKFPLALGSVAAELGASSEPHSFSQNQKTLLPMRQKGVLLQGPSCPRRFKRVLKLPGYSGFRFSLLSAPSQRCDLQWLDADFVYGHSCGAATVLHRLPRGNLRVVQVLLRDV
jgi:hypothetical protein